MSIDEAEHLVRERWAEEGQCASCGWHAALSEYGPLADSMTINHKKRRVELACLAEDRVDNSRHRGVRIYFDAEAGRDS